VTVNGLLNLSSIVPNTSHHGKYLISKVTATNTFGSASVFSKSNCDPFFNDACPNNTQYDIGWAFDNQTAQANHIVTAVNQDGQFSASLTLRDTQLASWGTQNYQHEISCSEASLPSLIPSESSRMLIELRVLNGVFSSSFEIGGQTRPIESSYVSSSGSRTWTSNFTVPQGTPNLLLVCFTSMGGWNNSDGGFGQGGFGDGYHFPLRIRGQ
jgi:hypothetical protein